MKRLITWTLLASVVWYGAFLAFRRWIFPRDPARTIPESATVVAPADGRIVYIEQVDDGVVPISIKGRHQIPLDEIVKGDDRPPTGTLIGIFLSPYDVHYQRSPIGGTVTEISYHPVGHNLSMGNMFVRNLFRLEPRYANSPHVYTNERNVLRIDGDGRTAFVVQIADQQVNKIDCYVGESDAVAIGEKIGMIRWGSQVDLFVPDAAPSDFEVRVGDKLYAGETVLIR